MVKRQRKLTGSKFVQTLVFGWIANPDASLEELSLLHILSFKLDETMIKVLFFRKTIQKHAMNLAIALASGCEGRLFEALHILQRCMDVGCRINKRKTKPHTYQLLLAVNG